MSKVNGSLRDDIVIRLAKSIRGQEAFESVKRMVEAIEGGSVAIADAEMFAPPTVAGERTFTFRFHLKAVG
jgi:hypothetical protein